MSSRGSFSVSESDESDESEGNAGLAAAITKAASQQTYYTVRCLVDQDRVADAYRTYAYFRWVDDWLDQNDTQRPERLAFVERQQMLIEGCYRGQWPAEHSTEEHMVVDLIRHNPQPNSGLHAYIQNMLAVMAFDADRRGQIVSQEALNRYTHHLAAAVTEALHYFIGHDSFSPQNKTRYLAVTAAHITHMLRDTFDDIAAGYFNIPGEFLKLHGIHAGDVKSDAYRLWVKQRVQLARACFRAGKGYLAQVKNLRCRVAGYMYMARFEGVLDAIEREDFRLRPVYNERKSLGAVVNMGWSALSLLLWGHQFTPAYHTLLEAPQQSTTR